MIDKAALRDTAATLLVAALLALGLVLLIAGLVCLAGIVTGVTDYWRWSLGWHGGFALWMVLFVLCMPPARRVGPALIARYDNAVLQVVPPITLDPMTMNPTGTQGACEQLRQWCFDGAGNGRSPLWRPWQIPHIELRFSIAVLTGVSADKSRVVETFSRNIDGTQQLENASGAAARWGVKLRVKWLDCLWWRARKPLDPWDSGYLVEDAIARRCLHAFTPRRATLIVAQALPPDALRAGIIALRVRQAGFHHPVRLLVVDTMLPELSEGAIDAVCPRPVRITI